MKKLCKTCNLEKSISEFGNNKYSLDGLNYKCNSCRAEYEQNRRIKNGIIPKIRPSVVSEFEKECLRCFTVLSLDRFKNSQRGRNGKTSYCEDCLKDYHKEIKVKDPESKEKARVSTQKYRDKNRERWRGLHRINQFERVNRVKVASDGTVTDEFLKELYNKVNCFWCGGEVPRNKRTAEHIIELINGGSHSASNLTMSCSSCNSSRKNRNNKNIKE